LLGRGVIDRRMNPPRVHAWRIRSGRRESLLSGFTAVDTDVRQIRAIAELTPQIAYRDRRPRVDLW
jgi:hypothetical protein